MSRTSDETARDALIRRLASAWGIEDGYWDVEGNWQAASLASMAATLKAMGAEIEGDDALAEACLAAERAPWIEPLPPVSLIAAEDASATVQLALKASTGRFGWQLTLEDGSQRAGEVDWPALALIGADEIDGTGYEQRNLELGAVPMGYHTLTIETGGVAHETFVIAAPERGYPVSEAIDGKAWLLGVQLYGLRSPTDWGVGDFTGLAELAGPAGRLGAAGLGISPIHAGFPAEPRHRSPYSPSSRSFVNWLHIDPRRAPGFDQSDLAAVPGAARIEALRAAELVDYQPVGEIKLAVLRRLWDRFESAPAADRQAFAAFVQEGGEALARQALFDALHFFHYGLMGAGEGGFDWRHWPEQFRDPAAPGAQAFAAGHADEVGFFAWLQWLADRQLAEIAEAAREAGMKIGLYRDLAVASDPTGADAWGDQTLYCPGVGIGAPPDPMNLKGQSWGLCPMDPRAMRRTRYAGFLTFLRANMRHAGAIRLDHAMSLMRLFWIPEGASAAEGLYLSYPYEELLGIVRIEARRHQCLVIGEDLGTVPEGFRPPARASDMLTSAVLPFQRDADGRYWSGDEYHPASLVSFGTHDMATAAGWWVGEDIPWRQEFEQIPAGPEGAHAARDERRQDLKLLLAVMREAGVLPEEIDVDDPPLQFRDSLNAALHGFLGQTRSRLMLVQMEDLLGVVDQANFPGTIDQHPNWRRRYPVPVGALADHPTARRVAEAVNHARARPDRDSS